MTEETTEPARQHPSLKTAHDVFAAVLRVLEPYAGDIVLIGGWVHALYLAELSNRGAVAGPPLITDDIDVTVPHTLVTRDRPALVDLVTAVGFQRDPLSDDEGAPVLLRQVIGAKIIDLDLLTEVDSPGTAVIIDGQAGLRVSGYPGQSILLENAQWMTVGTTLHPTLEPPVRVRVPTLSAYVFHKGLSSSQRAIEFKRVKDMVYLAEILRHPHLGPIAYTGLRTIALRYPAYYGQWERYLTRVISDQSFLRRIADQLLMANRAIGSEDDVGASVARRLRRAVLIASGTI